jgi:hypothetical protein
MTMLPVTPDLIAALKRLGLGRIAETLPERLVLAEKQDMSFEDLPLLVVTTRSRAAAADSRALRPASIGGAAGVDFFSRFLESSGGRGSST